MLAAACLSSGAEMLVQTDWERQSGTRKHRHGCSFPNYISNREKWGNILTNDEAENSEEIAV